MREREIENDTVKVLFLFLVICRFRMSHHYSWLSDLASLDTYSTVEILSNLGAEYLSQILY